METRNVTDSELLHRVKSGSRDAMGVLVARYIDFVYGCARRQVRDAHLAKDVTQAVFVILWTKARAISSEVILHAWLFNTTRYASANAIRMRARRARHEREAAKMRSRSDRLPVADNPVGSMLDDALSTLRERDRSALLLSFFAGQSWSQVGSAMGISAEAARKRGDRAIDKLRDYFTRHGVAFTGASLSIAAQPIPTPASLARDIGTSCTIATLATSASSSVSQHIAQGVIHMMTLAKIKLAGAVAAAMLVTVGMAGAVAIHYEPKPAPVQTQAAAPIVGRLENGLTVEVTALSQRSGTDRSWWNPDGSGSETRFDDVDSVDDPPHTHQMLFKISGLEPGYGVTWRFSNSRNWSAVPATLDGVAIDEGAQVISFRPDEGAKSTDLTVAVASGRFRVVATKREMGEWQREGDENGEVILSACVNLHGGAGIAYTESFENCQRRIVAFDSDGQEHLPSAKGGERSARLNLEIVHFDLPVEEIERIEFQIRMYDQVATIKDISLDPGRLTHPTVITGPTTQPDVRDRR